VLSSLCCSPNRSANFIEKLSSLSIKFNDFGIPSDSQAGFQRISLGVVSSDVL